MASYKLKSFIRRLDINWRYLCLNPHNGALDMIKKNLDKLDNECWLNLHHNTNNRAHKLLIENNKLDENIEMIKQTEHKIVDYSEICINISKYSVEELNIICSIHDDKIIELISCNLDKLYPENWNYIWSNPCIWTLIWTKD